MSAIKKLTIQGYKSIRSLEDFALGPLNVLIGANGAGKSNFVGFFHLLHELVEQRLQLEVAREGGLERCLFLGQKLTNQIAARLSFAANGYEFRLVPTVDGRLVFADETAVFDGTFGRVARTLGWGHAEAKLKDERGEPGKLGSGHGIPYYVYEAVSSWTVYHFHDTSESSRVRRQGPINDNERLRADAENLAAFLFRVQQTNPLCYGRIRDAIRLAAPFFGDFKLRPMPANTELIQLEWLQEDSDYLLLPSQLSDGTLRFICLATALLQPSPPSTMLFDEPELGLHPYALTLLGNLFQQTARMYGSSGRSQLVVSTQSAPLLSEFAPEDVIVVDRSRGESQFRRVDPAQLSTWLEEYSLGELWQKNVLGGRPRREDTPPESSEERENSVPLPEPRGPAGHPRP